jgi:Protein of unknown function (DUF3106)
LQQWGAGKAKLRRGQQIMRWLATGLIATGLAVIANSLPCLAQGNSSRPPVVRTQAQSHPPNQAPRNQRAPGQAQRGHAGDWLRQYKDLPPGEQERALQNDPHFRSLPPARQRQLRQQLRYFSSLPRQQQEHILALMKRGEVFGGLTPEQRQRLMQIHNQILQLPPDRQRMVRNAIRDLRGMPPAEREQVIDSDRFKNTFSPHEREILRGVTRLPLAPAENSADTAPPQE